MFWEDPGQRRPLTSQHAASPLMAQEDARWTHPSSFLFLELWVLCMVVPYLEESRILTAVPSLELDHREGIGQCRVGLGWVLDRARVAKAPPAFHLLLWPLHIMLSLF